MRSMMEDGTMMGWPWTPVVGSMVLFAVVALIVMAVWALMDRTRRAPDEHAPPPGKPTGDPAWATLRDRFARGEIDRDEYDERRRALER